MEKVIEIVMTGHLMQLAAFLVQVDLHGWRG
jgi:hypothetical protein